MRRPSPRAHAGFVLAATLLPLCVFASPLRLQLARFDSAVTDVPDLSAQTLQDRTAYGLTQALALDKGRATLVAPGALEDADLLVGGKLGRNGTKYQLVYVLQTRAEPRLRTQLSYEFVNPRLSDRGVTVMAQEVLTEAVKLEEARKAQAAAAPQPTPAPEPEPRVARAPAAPPPEPERVSSPPVPQAPREREPVASLEPEAPSNVFEARQQPLVVIHTGLTGLYVPGSGAAGFGAAVEPKWNITDSLAAGFRFDGGVTMGGSIAARGTTSFSAGASAATLVKGEFLLGRHGVRPFVGVGAGMYMLANQSVAASVEGAGLNQSGGTFFGVAPQFGVDFGGVRLGLTYNHILGADVVVEQNINAGIEAERIHRNYLQVEIAFRVARFGTPRRPVGASRY
ncbi:hypothetical protein [Pyxidicoccus sp. MSG2]|uniref:hypothetical protein n=1 Tax=Pyxidicoccus sp. MSG2 TaxID=2996790 RepID=UPI00226DFB7C|nr:hypothetical protein [Pyxidicoccus sp. MSG2]MCY1014572.1 hypothetical protein [Pyxidicoccus sp. MSG2]